MKSVRGTMLGALRCMQTGKNNVRITYRLCQQQRKAEKRKKKNNTKTNLILRIGKLPHVRE